MRGKLEICLSPDSHTQSIIDIIIKDISMVCDSDSDHGAEIAGSPDKTI